MLLQPRKFKHKSLQKNRRSRKWSKHSLVYGTSGLKIQHSVRMSAKRIYRFKLFLKRAARKSDKTQRYMWFIAFPHLPLTRKGKGSRMGKGAGKLSTWHIQIKPGTVMVEFKHLRYGRSAYFFKQVAHKTSANLQHLVTSLCFSTLRHVSRAAPVALPFN